MPTSFEITVNGRCWAKSVTASNVPRSTSRSTSASASVTSVGVRSRSASAINGRRMMRRISSWRGGSHEINATPPVAVLSCSLSITPRADEKTSQSRAAARVSA